ncbi:MAG: hypothetical protein FJ253_08110 [Phycisphaerae bacterium]|nr:hypothetical protein [Phycisphaerae bacterium]
MTLTEIAVSIVAIACLAAVIVPTLGAGRSRSRELKSLANLKTLAAAHAAYAADWSDRQFTHMPDELALAPTYPQFIDQFGCPQPITLGFGASAADPKTTSTWAFWLPCHGAQGNANSFQAFWPFPLGGNVNGAMFELCNAVGFNEYVGGRFMDPTFYAPADEWRLSEVGPGLASEHPFTFTSGAGEPWMSSYILSPAAMYHPVVFGGGPSGLFVVPTSTPLSSVSPTVSQCAHPELKSRMTEHSWLQSPPLPRNPAFTGASMPFHFNLGSASTPMTLFFDGHVAGMSIRKVVEENADAVAAGGFGESLWIIPNGIGPWAAYGGYYSAVAQWDAGSENSVHVFTRKGILGRDGLTPY